MRFVRIGVVTVFLSMTCGPGVADTRAVRFTGLTMGTTYEVQIPRAPESIAQARLETDAKEILKALEDLMSTYRSDSEITRFNHARTTEWFPASPDTGRVMAEALRISRFSSGAFDVSVAPLVELWGFGAADAKRVVPHEDAIDAALSHVGTSMIRVRERPAALRKLDSDVKIDLSAAAKGFAVDKLAEHLLVQGIADFLVEIGGEIRAAGSNGAGEPWTVAIEGPDGNPSEVRAIITLTDAAVATSGDYRNFFQHEGIRYSHVIDPRTGRPIAHRRVSVAVIDPSAMRADSLATALLVLGPEQGLQLAARENIAALFMASDAGEIQHTSTPEFRRHVLLREDEP